MANFSTAVLRHSCTWDTAENDCTQIQGFPDSITLDCNQGYEVLHFINRYMHYRGWGSPSTFQDIESALKTRLPFSIRSHSDVKNWLDTNFKR